MKRTLLMTTLVSFLVLETKAQVTNTATNQAGDTSRIERAKKKYQELFGQQIMASKTDPELMDILQKLIFVQHTAS